MVTLSAMREDVLDALKAAGINAQDYSKEAFVPPCVALQPAPAYITTPANGTFQQPHRVSYELLVIAGKKTSTSAVEQIESLLEQTIEVVSDEWTIDNVTNPAYVDIKGVPYLACVVEISQNTYLGKE